MSSDRRPGPQLKLNKTKQFRETGTITCEVHGIVEDVVFCHKKWPKCRECFNEARRQKRSEQKLRAIEYAGGCCSQCGYDTYMGALEFHHLDPSKKDFQVNETLRPWKTIKKEIDKCILVCANCHREIHAGLRKV